MCQTASMVGGAPRERRTILLDRRFDEAFDLAVEAHRLESRPGGAISHIGHLLAVAALVIDDGGDAAQAIAALLHDVGRLGDDAVADVGVRFGPRVERIVKAVGGGRPPAPQDWQRVKAEHIARLPASPPESWRVSLADALSEARYVLADLRQHGPLAYDADHGRSLQAYHRCLVDIYTALAPGPLVDEYARVVAEIGSTSW